MIEKIRSDFYEFHASLLGMLPNLVTAIVILAMFIALGKLFQKLYEKRLRIRWKDNIFSRFMAQLIKWSLYLFGLIFALHILGFGGLAGSVLAGAGISAIIIGFAFKDIAENFLAGLLLGINRPFKINDIIEINNVKGTVRGLDLRTTHLRIVDGRDIYIPNSMIIKNILTNYTRDGLIRLDFQLGLDTNCDTEKARILILNKLKMLTEFGLLVNPPPNVTIEAVGVSTIDLRVFFWVNVFREKKYDEVLQGEMLKSKVIREVVDLLDKNGYSFPSYVLEHKIYKQDEPIPVKVQK